MSVWEKAKLLVLCHRYLQNRMAAREELHWRYYMDNEVTRYITGKYPVDAGLQQLVAHSSMAMHRIEASVLDYSRLHGIEEQRSVLHWLGYGVATRENQASPSIRVRHGWDVRHRRRQNA